MKIEVFLLLLQKIEYMFYLLRFSLLFFICTNWAYSQYLYSENFNDISDWTTYSSGNNSWINAMGNDSIFGVEGKCIFVSCATCVQNPIYEIGLVANQTYIKMNSHINIPSANYKIKFDYYNIARPADDLRIEYSYDNSSWQSLSSLNMTTKWKTVTFPITSLSGFSPGVNVYFRFFFDIGTIVTPTTRLSCGIDNFSIVTTDWDITNLGTILTISNNDVLYIKNADYQSDNASSLNHAGTLIFDNGGSLFFNGSYSSSGDTIRFVGGRNQTLVAPVNPVGTIWINKPQALETVLVDSFLEIKDRLHFVKGTLKPGAKRFPINLTTSNNPIASDSGFVDGKVKYYANITDRLFPTGNEGVYRPIVLDNGTLHYTIRYKRETSPASFVPNVLNGISNNGYWIVRMESFGSPGAPGTLKTKIHFASGDGVSAVDETRIAFSPDNIQPYYTDENWILTHSGTTSNGTIEVNDAIASSLYYIRLGFAKNGKINLKAMLQGPLMSKKKVLWEDVNFNVSNWNLSGGGTMTFQLQANATHVYDVNKPWKDAFKGLAFINTTDQDNRWAIISSGDRTAQMNANVPVSFSVSEKYFLEFEYLYDGNAFNALQLQYSVNNGTTWNDLPITATPNTFQKWQTFSLELNSTNFPGFIKGTTPIRFGFKASWGSPHITDSNVPAPLISKLRVVQETAQPEEMTSYLSSAYILDSLVKIEQIPTKFKVPNNVVDTIHIEIRDNNTSSYNIIDHQTVWLLNDGTIKNLSGVNHVKLVNTNSGTGYMVIKHRNHLPVMTPNPISYNTTTSSTVIDFTDIVNIKDGTAYKYRTGPDKYALYLGNVTEDFPNGDYYETNATDFFVVSSKVDQLPDRNYHREDINLDGYVNAEDFDLVQIGNNNLYFTTVPEP